MRAVSQKMNTKRDKVQKEKDEIGERIGPKITGKKTENKGKSASLLLVWAEGREVIPLAVCSI